MTFLWYTDEMGKTVKVAFKAKTVKMNESNAEWLNREILRKQVFYF